MLGAGLALAGVRWLGAEPEAVDAATSTQRVEPAERENDRTAEREHELQAFLEGLQHLRENDESVLPDLRACAERLCTEHDRCDVRDVLGYYAALPPVDRAHGLEEDRRLAELWDEVRRARRENFSEDEWKRARAPILAELAAMIARNIDGPDSVPAARALSLRARLTVEQADGEREFEPEQVEELLASATSDVLACLTLFERSGQLKPRLEPLWIQGRIQAARFDQLAAQTSFETCRALARHVSNESFEEHALAGLIRLSREAGDLNEIERLLRELARFRRPSQSWLLVNRQADLLLQREYAAEAARFLERYPPADATEHREWRVMLGSAALRAGDIAAARRAYVGNERAPWAPDVKLAMASLSLREGDATAVVHALTQPKALDDLTLDQHSQASHLLGAARIRLRHFESAIEPLTRALDDGTRIQARLRQQREVANAVGEVVGVETLALLARAHAELGHGLEAARVIEVYQTLSLRSAIAADAVEPRSDAGVLERRELASDDIVAWAGHFERGLVTWVVGADSTVVAHVAPDGHALALPIEIGRKAIEDAVRRLREATIAGDDRARTRIANEISAELFPAALRNSIANTRTGRLLCLLHGPLERLPVELFEPDGALIHGTLVPVILPGLPGRTPGAARAALPLERWSVLGSPLGADGLRLLPGASAELAAVAAFHPGAVLAIESAFERDALLAALRSGRPLHVATHLEYGVGSRERRLADVGLELSGDDALSATEILRAHPELPLAVLLACETGDGDFLDSLGLHGVARAFLESGTRNLVVTQWPVEDRAAQSFAEALHRALVAGVSPSQACAEARAALRAAGFPAAEWAAFRALGRD